MTSPLIPSGRPFDTTLVSPRIYRHYHVLSEFAKTYMTYLSQMGLNAACICHCLLNDMLYNQTAVHGQDIGWVHVVPLGYKKLGECYVTFPTTIDTAFELLVSIDGVHIYGSVSSDRMWHLDVTFTDVLLTKTTLKQGDPIPNYMRQYMVKLWFDEHVGDR